MSKKLYRQAERLIAVQFVNHDPVPELLKEAVDSVAKEIDIPKLHTLPNDQRIKILREVDISLFRRTKDPLTYHYIRVFLNYLEETTNANTVWLGRDKLTKKVEIPLPRILFMHGIGGEDENAMRMNELIFRKLGLVVNYNLKVPIVKVPLYTIFPNPKLVGKVNYKTMTGTFTLVLGYSESNTSKEKGRTNNFGFEPPSKL